MTKLFLLRTKKFPDRAKLAVLIGCDSKTLYNHEHGKGGRATRMLRQALANALGVKESVIFSPEGFAK